MTSMGDIGRELNEIRDHPQSTHPQSELDRLEARLHEFFAWSHGRPHPEIRSQFAAEFSNEPLHDEVVHAIGEGKGAEVRDRLPVAAADEPPAGSAS
jgi:hypothetical protein